MNVKFKKSTKLRSYGKHELIRKNLCVKEKSLVQNKINYREYMDEIFAGLIWLG